jgi:methyl-accepting chemotaxis protein
MSEEITRIAERLRELSTRLRDPELPDEEAEALAREAADLAAKGGTELDRALREIAERGEPDPGDPGEVP